MREVITYTVAEKKELVQHKRTVYKAPGSGQSTEVQAHTLFKGPVISAGKSREIVSIPLASTNEEVSTRRKNSSIAVSATDGITSGSVSIGVDSDSGEENKKRFIPSLSSLQAGDQEEWTRWIEESTRILEGVAARIMKNRSSRDDLIQETWIKALKSIKTVQNPSSVNPWLTRILINTINSNYRSERHTIDFEEKDAFLNAIPAKGEDIEERIGSQDGMNQYIHLIERLSPEMAEQIVFIIEGGYSVPEIAEILDIPLGTVKSRRHRALKILQGLLEGDESADDDTKKEYEVEKENNQKWMSALHFLPKDGTQVATYLRLSTYLSKEAFARKAGMGVVAITKGEQGRHSIYQINSVIDASALGLLGPNSLPAQYARAKVFNLELKTCKELKQCSSPQLKEYLRILKGVTRDETKAEAGKDPTEAFIALLDLNLDDPHDSALAQVIRKKSKKLPELNDEIYQLAVSGKYLFAEQLTPIKHYKLAHEDAEIRRKISRKKVGSAIRHMREAKGLTLRELGELLSHSSAALNRIELGEVVPEDYITAHIMFGLNFDIHHPLTLEILAKADNERKKRDAQLARARLADPEDKKLSAVNLVDLAKAAEVSVSTLQRFIQGENIKSSTLEKIIAGAKVLGVTDGLLPYVARLYAQQEQKREEQTTGKTASGETRLSEISNRALAKSSGINHETIRRIKLGYPVKIITLERFIAALESLGVTSEELAPYRARLDTSISTKNREIATE